MPPNTPRSRTQIERATIAPKHPRYAYTTLSSEKTTTLGDEMSEMGAEGWRVISVFVRFDTVHVVFEREIL